MKRKLLGFWQVYLFSLMFLTSAWAVFLGLPHHGSYNSTSIQSLQPPPQDLGMIYTFGRSPVLPKRRNGLFSNPIKTQHWTHEGTAPSGGGYQTGTRDPIQKEANNAPQSILVKPDAHKHNPEKVKTNV